MGTLTVLGSLLHLLNEMRSMIERIDDESYSAPARGRIAGGIGGHVRHCLDHISAFIAATRIGFCAYDRRARGTAVETCRVAALRCILDVEADVLRLDNRLFEMPVDVETQVDTDGSFLVTTSTVGRELMFVISHTIHHNALIAHLLEEHAIDMGTRFGLALATPVAVCAR
jgi:uncharacterized damage-inducible protein DinB